ncbi:hypothetical protein K438DRAFT_2721 [Mycena galopus ATCC 62051]|nr:hypothetical protein K438DRAFT_2721 [Mycena galopus ATCC 62051]
MPKANAALEGFASQVHVSSRGRKRLPCYLGTHLQFFVALLLMTRMPVSQTHTAPSRSRRAQSLTLCGPSVRRMHLPPPPSSFLDLDALPFFPDRPLPFRAATIARARPSRLAVEGASDAQYDASHRIGIIDVAISCSKDRCVGSSSLRPPFSPRVTLPHARRLCMCPTPPSVPSYGRVRPALTRAAAPSRARRLYGVLLRDAGRPRPRAPLSVSLPSSFRVDLLHAHPRLYPGPRDGQDLRCPVPDRAALARPLRGRWTSSSSSPAC